MIVLLLNMVGIAQRLVKMLVCNPVFGIRAVTKLGI